jgi:hypothetical protein
VLWINAVDHAAIESGRPVLYIGSARSDVHALCAERLKAPYSRVGIDDVNGCWQALEALARLSAASEGGDAAEMGGAERGME